MCERTLGALESMLSLVSTLVFLFQVGVYANEVHYQIWCMGQGCGHDVTTSTTPGTALMGGGSEVDEAFEWQISHANGGDLIVMRASGDDAYNQYIYDLSVGMSATLNSVTTIRFYDREASYSEEVLTLLRNAESIFFAGGDQNNYISFWADTEVQRIIQDKLDKITIGGTSAGLAILGHWVYTGQYGSAYSDESTLNPFNKFLTFAPALFNVKFMEHVITDTHFEQRERMGRMLAFVARQLTASSSVTGMGVDAETALLLDVSGKIQTVGLYNAFICSVSGPAEVCEPDTPLTLTGIGCHRLSGLNSDTFDMVSMTGTGVSYVNDVVNGIVSQPSYGPV